MSETIILSGVEFEIYNGGEVGVSVSGGADSGLLLYILMKYGKFDIHVFTCASKEKNRVAPKVVTEVISKCIDLTNFKNRVYHHVHYVEVQTYDALFGNIKIINNRLGLPVIYTGVTNNPDEGTTSTFKNQNNGLGSIRDPSKIKPTSYGFTKDTKIYTPMFNIDKTKVREIYDELGIRDVLFPITRSCESTTLTQGHCGDCWWCEERLWAFGGLE